MLHYLSAVVEKYRRGNHRQIEQPLQLIWFCQNLQGQGPYCLPRAMEAQGFRFILRKTSPNIRAS